MTKPTISEMTAEISRTAGRSPDGPVILIHRVTRRLRGSPTTVECLGRAGELAHPSHQLMGDECYVLRAQIDGVNLLCECDSSGILSGRVVTVPDGLAYCSPLQFS
jgi:hypothetical protein